MGIIPGIEGAPEKGADLPRNQPPAWKVPMKKHRPSLKTAPSMEGPHENASTLSFPDLGWLGL